MRIGPIQKSIHPLLWFGIVASLFLLPVASLALGPSAGSATISTPQRIAGASGKNDARDADVYSKVAYDAATQRYLVVWLTPRNATSTSDDFDVYGQFLDRQGQPAGSEFRISDQNTAARSSLPSVVAGNGAFVVAWTVKNANCDVVMQKVSGTFNDIDRVLVNGSGQQHSPALAYNPARQRFVLAYVDGDDYLPPTFFGANIADCGNNASSTSRIKAIEFALLGVLPVINPNTLSLSESSLGGFRPALAYSPGLDQFLVAWEDRRSAAGQLYKFDVFAQRLEGQFSLTGTNFALATGDDYTNFDTTATWTPRPAVASANDQFLTAWFHRAPQNDAVIWSVIASLVPASGASPANAAFPVAAITFAQDHTGNSPGGYLSAAYSWASDEFLVGFSSYMESIWGYRSFVLVQRVNSSGQLLKLDGSILSQPGVGVIVDHENEDQLAPGLAVNPFKLPGITEFQVVYSKHKVSSNEEDIDIWSVKVGEAAVLRTILLPAILK